MPVDEKDFLDSAKASIKGSSQEIDFRNSASRAYYCSLHLCKKIVDTFPTIGDKSKGGLHAQIIDQLSHPPTSVLKEKIIIA